MAHLVGVTPAVYTDIECGVTKHIPQAVIEQLSAFYGVPLTDFMDGYHRFLYNGQAQCIREYRAKMGLGKKNFARAMGIPIRSLQSWESGRKVMSRQSWEKYFNSWLEGMASQEIKSLLIESMKGAIKNKKI